MGTMHDEGVFRDLTAFFSRHDEGDAVAGWSTDMRGIDWYCEGVDPRAEGHTRSAIARRAARRRRRV